MVYITIFAVYMVYIQIYTKYTVYIFLDGNTLGGYLVYILCIFGVYLDILCIYSVYPVYIWIYTDGKCISKYALNIHWMVQYICEYTLPGMVKLVYISVYLEIHAGLGVFVYIVYIDGIHLPCC